MTHIDKPIYRDKDWLQEHYVDQGLSLQGCADLGKCHSQAIKNWLIKHGIPLRPKLKTRTATLDDWRVWYREGKDRPGKRPKKKKAKQARPKKGPREKTCAWCRELFVGAANKYCSPECATAYYENVLHTRGRFLIFRRDGFRCIYCGRTSMGDDEVILNAEHIVPRIEGGANEAGNLVTACQRCNLEKNRERLPEYIEKKVLLLVAHRNETQGIANGLTIKLVGT